MKIRSVACCRPAARGYNEIHLKIDVGPEVDDRQNRFNQLAT